jgi:glycosyltransferase involved in cell wall biosynthesis
MRVIQTIASTRSDHGGPSRSVPQLSDALVERGIDNHLVTTIPADASIPCIFPSDRGRVHTTPEHRLARQWGVSERYIQILSDLAVSPNQTIIHDHALWLPTNHAVAQFAYRNAIRRLVSPRGMLSEWAFSRGRWKKRIAWWMYQKRDLQRASAFHATSQQEAIAIRNLGFNQPICIASNGLSTPDPLPTRTRSLETRVALFLGRIHPVKGLILLVDAWCRSRVPNNWLLWIAGPDETGYRREVEAKIVKYSASNISFLGNLNDDEKWRVFVNSDLFVLPSYSENFGIAIAEAMSCGLPVLTTTGTPWNCLKDNQLGWWVEPTAESIGHALEEAFSMPENDLKSIGDRARKYVNKTFSWNSTAQSLQDLYCDMLYS